MTPSVSPEADWELTEEAIYYAREGGGARRGFHHRVRARSGSSMRVS
jgi:hypothetical protein